jgi:hypothetical protein
MHYPGKGSSIGQLGHGTILTLMLKNCVLHVSSQDLLPTRQADILHTFQVSFLSPPVADPPISSLSLVVFSLLSHVSYPAHLLRATSPPTSPYLLKTRPTFDRTSTTTDLHKFVRPQGQLQFPIGNPLASSPSGATNCGQSDSSTVPSRAVCPNETAENHHTKYSGALSRK